MRPVRVIPVVHIREPYSLQDRKCYTEEGGRHLVPLKDPPFDIYPFMAGSQVYHVRMPVRHKCLYGVDEPLCIIFSTFENVPSIPNLMKERMSLSLNNASEKSRYPDTPRLA